MKTKPTTILYTLLMILFLTVSCESKKDTTHYDTGTAVEDVESTESADDDLNKRITEEGRNTYPNFLEKLVEMDSFTVLIAHMTSSRILDTLHEENIYTLFAPTDGAFKKMKTNNQNIDELIKSHIAAAYFPADRLKDDRALTTLNNRALNIHIKNGNAFVENAKILNEGIESRNGIIYIIDNVIEPFK